MSASLSSAQLPFLTEVVRPFLTTSAAPRRRPLHGMRKIQGMRWRPLGKRVLAMLSPKRAH